MKKKRYRIKLSSKVVNIRNVYFNGLRPCPHEYKVIKEGKDRYLDIGYFDEKPNINIVVELQY